MYARTDVENNTLYFSTKFASNIHTNYAIGHIGQEGKW